MKLGVENLLSQKKYFDVLKKKRVALMAHPASVDHRLKHSLDLIADHGKIKLSAAFGPQHGMRGDKQDNMIESSHYEDPVLGIPVFSLYGEVRRPTADMMDTFDVILFDLQDIGTRIYTYVTTLFYMMQECEKKKKSIWVLDRPNPVGRPIEGHTFLEGWESFVGVTPLPMRHGLTMGEMANWIKDKFKMNLDLRVIKMSAYHINKSSGFGWPQNELSWVNPSPNVPTVSTCRCFPGTVFLEACNLSEGRGTTVPLQLFGHPELRAKDVVDSMYKEAPQLSRGVEVRYASFEPTFHKFQGKLCHGLQLHVEHPIYNHEKFKPYRWMAMFFKHLKKCQPGLFEWRQPPYEYEHTRLPVDLLCGSTKLRQWVDDSSKNYKDLDEELKNDEKLWLRERKPYLIY